MPKIEDLLNKTVREETDVTKGSISLSITVYIVIICSVIISVILCPSLLLGFYCVTNVDGYLQDTKQIINLYDFYDQKVGENETAVFFLGSSIVGWSMYPTEINRIVKMDYPNITTYNLAESGDLPIERALEIQKIIDAKPSLVIYGITYRSVMDKIDYGRFFDRTKLVYPRLDIRNDSLPLYNAEEKMYFTPFNEFEKKRYLKSAIDYKFAGSSGSVNYSFDYLGGEQSRKLAVKNDQKIITQVNDPNFIFRPVVTNESTRYKDALIYNVKTLQDAGVPVIIINMPLHPLLSERITDESRANYYDLLNETGAVWYDFEHCLDEDSFSDSHHVIHIGALKLAPRIADLIIEQVEKDVIHYT
ncbi:hypothetical protein [Methanomicrobium mobile]|uniref:hypothetical protein n=1 Tax=Methanomicrobium mobile TaxID=2205 RepID=UPI0005B26DB2|nr:hypothetical protein [Methanomicrobium mobile]